MNEWATLASNSEKKSFSSHPSSFSLLLLLLHHHHHRRRRRRAFFSLFILFLDVLFFGIFIDLFFPLLSDHSSVFTLDWIGRWRWRIKVWTRSMRGDDHQRQTKRKRKDHRWQLNRAQSQSVCLVSSRDAPVFTLMIVEVIINLELVTDLFLSLSLSYSVTQSLSLCRWRPFISSSSITSEDMCHMLQLFLTDKMNLVDAFIQISVTMQL